MAPTVVAVTAAKWTIIDCIRCTAEPADKAPSAFGWSCCNTVSRIYGHKQRVMAGRLHLAAAHGS